MTRVIHETGVDLVSEVVAPNTEIQWNPATNEGQVVFRCERFTWCNGQLISRAPERALIVPLAQVLGDVFEVATPAGTLPVPGMLVAGAIKAAFDRYWREHTAEPAPDAEAPVLAEVRA